MPTPIRALLLVLLLAGGAARVAPAPPAIEADRLRRHVEVLASEELEGRGAGSEGGRLAAAYVAARMRAAGLEPAGDDGFLAPFEDRGRTLRNVIGRLPGSDPALAGESVVLGAHHDHLGRRGETWYPGADDNASGVAALLEIARVLAADPPRRSVLFVTFDAEERGLRGSRHFVARPPVPRDAIVAMLNVDMLGRGARGHAWTSGRTWSSDLAAHVEAAAERHGATLHAEHERDWLRASDHFPFHEAGIPFLYVGVLDHEDYHRPTDTPDKIDAEHLATLTRVVLDTLRAVADAEERPAPRSE